MKISTMHRYPKAILIMFIGTLQLLHAQPSYERSLSLQQQQEDLAFFIKVGQLTNSGLYRYRTKAQIDSSYRWAYAQLAEGKNIIDLYKVIFQLTDFEGSSHNATTLPDDLLTSLKNDDGFFPLPVKWIQDALLVNTTAYNIPLGAKISRINDVDVSVIIDRLKKYYTTDGYSIKSKWFSLFARFNTHYRLEFGKQTSFTVEYTSPGSATVQTINLPSVNFNSHDKLFEGRHSAPFDSLVNYTEGVKKYEFRILSPSTAYLRLRIFTIGNNAQDKEHKQYVKFLDSCFAYLQQHAEIKNLLVDTRGNPGGSDPNDQITFSHFASKPFQENTSAYISFNQIPEWKYVMYKAFFLKRWIAKGVYQSQLKRGFPNLVNGNYYSAKNDDNTPRQPSTYTYRGQVYLLINPSIASACSHFTAMMRGHTNAIVVGEETEGGYYGHNGHQPIGYYLPHSRIGTIYSIVNLDQDVPRLEKQPVGSGILPDYEVTQTFADLMANRDTQFEFVLQLIQNSSASLSHAKP